MSFNRFLPLLLILTSCTNNETSFTAEEYNQLRPNRKRMTIFDKMKEHSEEELAWKRENEIFQVVVKRNNQIFVRGKLVELKDLKRMGKRFFYKYRENLDSPFADDAMISLRNIKGVEYSFYLSVYNELRQIYSELWEEEAQKSFKISFEKLKMLDKKLVRERIPLIISESEPAEF